MISTETKKILNNLNSNNNHWNSNNSTKEILKKINKINGINKKKTNFIIKNYNKKFKIAGKIQLPINKNIDILYTDLNNQNSDAEIKELLGDGIGNLISKEKFSKKKVGNKRISNALINELMKKEVDKNSLSKIFDTFNLNDALKSIGATTRDSKNTKEDFIEQLFWSIYKKNNKSIKKTSKDIAHLRHLANNKNHIKPFNIKKMILKDLVPLDPKSQLQKTLQEKINKRPIYVTKKKSNYFESSVCTEGICRIGKGNTKIKSEQNAAKNLLIKLGKDLGEDFFDFY